MADGAQVEKEAGSHGRTGSFSADPLLPIRLFWDIGGAGAKADAVPIGSASGLVRRSACSITSKASVRCLATTPTN